MPPATLYKATTWNLYVSDPHKSLGMTLDMIQKHSLEKMEEHLYLKDKATYEHWTMI